MYWTWKKQSDNKTYISWGQPRSMPQNSYYDLNPDYNIPVYNGKKMRKSDKVVYCMQGDSTLGMGDSIWLISYLRDIYRILGKRKIELHICSSEWINNFYSHFLPSTIKFREEYITKEEFDSFDHKLPAMYYWREEDNADKSWLDNQSILERLYKLVGIQYNGLPDWGEFTPDYIMSPNKEFYERLNINKNDNYIFFQWHSSGIAKNIPPKTNIKILRYLIEKYPDWKIYIIGRLNSLNKLEEIHSNIKNLSNKTTAEDVFSLAINSELIICPDSAGIHLGEAYQIPTVGIFSVLPPVYVAKNYKIPTYMFGSGKCPYKPCGHIDKLPIETKCPKDTKKYCRVMDDIDLELFQKCINKSFKNIENFRITNNVDFYDSMNLPIHLKQI